MGGGHIIRCLSLARAFRERGAHCVFLVRRAADHLLGSIRDHGFECRHLTAHAAEAKPSDDGTLEHWLPEGWERDVAECKDAVGDLNVDWFVVDHYALDIRWHRAMASLTSKLLVIDDLGLRPLGGDIVLDPTFRSGRVIADAISAADTRLLSGPEFTLTSPEYATAHKRAAVRTRLEHLFIYLGNVPAGHHTAVLDAVAQTELTADIVASPHVCADDLVQRHRAIASGRVQLHAPLPSLLPLMETADAAIGPIGSSTWERGCLGLPTAAITIASNQEQLATDLHNAGITHLIGAIEDVGTADYLAALQYLSSEHTLPRMSEKSLQLFDGRGIYRVADALAAHMPRR